MITSINQLDPQNHYTYGDYILWKFQERVELLKGRLFPMAAPNVQHQRISSYLHTTLGMFLLNQKCDLFSAPFDVRLPLPTQHQTTDKIDTVIQPDLCVICDEKKLDKQGCIGAPDLVVEILSPGNSKKEMKFKLDLYEEAGVLEYWIIDPTHQVAHFYYLNADSQRFIAARPLADDDILKSMVLEGFELDLGKIFPKETE